MSFPQNGRDMDQPPGPGGSVRRARERALAGLPREQAFQMDEEPQIAQPTAARRGPGGPTAAGQSRLPRPQAPLQTKNGQIGVAISRPTPVPQWPLTGPLTSPPSSAGSEPYKPPPGRSERPQRPPRPSRVPSILDGSKIQDHTPVFQYRPQSDRESSGPEQLTAPETPSSLSRPSTLSSVASIPDFPLPIQMPPGPPRRSVNLGPPPSARRGASSFYSNASFVSPIPEESPRSRSHGSFASSAAMPESWGTASPGPSPNYPEGAFFDDTIAEESGQSVIDDDAEESRLVRSASIGKRGKPTLVTTTAPSGPPPTARAPDPVEPSARPGPSPVQNGQMNEGAYLDLSSSSSGTVPTARSVTGSAVTPDVMLTAYNSASSSDPSNPRGTPSPQPPLRPYSRLSAIRRPPKLDIDAVRTAEQRGSLTSLPDLIRRATRLAASLERGRRPASRFDLDDYPERERFGEDGEKDYAVDAEKYQSGLSDMLAAFPPPAQANNNRRSIRQSFQQVRQSVQSWPLPVALGGRAEGDDGVMDDASSPTKSPKDQKRGRRCCGLPLWGFIVVMIIVLILVAAAVVIPLEFFVIRKQNSSAAAQSALQQCQQQVTCANGGTNVVNSGFCSCICTNGFTGFDCTVSGAQSCTTASVSDTSNFTNVTLGDALPRLIQQAQTNFSIALSGSTIISKFSAGNLSCTAENALVTFDGRNTRQGVATAEVNDPNMIIAANAAAAKPNVVNGVEITTITIVQGPSTAVTLRGRDATKAAGPPLVSSPLVSPTDALGVGYPTAGSSTTQSSLPATTTTTVFTTVTPPAPSATFMVTEEILDFARIAVLFILQQEDLDKAESAQGALQTLFTAASKGSASQGSGVTLDQAKNVTLGNGNSVNLVNFLVDTSVVPITGGTHASTSPTKRSTKARAAARADKENRERRPRGWLVWRRWVWPS